MNYGLALSGAAELALIFLKRKRPHWLQGALPDVFGWWWWWVWLQSTVSQGYLSPSSVQEEASISAYVGKDEIGEVVCCLADLGSSAVDSIGRLHSSSHVLAVGAGELVEKKGQWAHGGIESLGHVKLGA